MSNLIGLFQESLQLESWCATFRNGACLYAFRIRSKRIRISVQIVDIVDRVLTKISCFTVLLFFVFVCFLRFQPLVRSKTDRFRYRELAKTRMLQLFKMIFSTFETSNCFNKV